MSSWRNIILTQHFERTTHKRGMCVSACTKRKKKGGGRQRGPWDVGGKKDFPEPVTAHTHTHTNLDIYLRYTCLEITLLKILSKALRS